MVGIVDGHELDNESSISSTGRTFSTLSRVQLKYTCIVYRVSYPTNNVETLRGLKRLER
jgi:hypothetical protein